MKGKLAGNLLRMLLAFFAGVIVTLYVLAPGDRKLMDLVKGSTPAREWADFGQAAGKVEQLGDQTVAFFYRTESKLKNSPTQTATN